LKRKKSDLKQVQRGFEPGQSAFKPGHGGFKPGQSGFKMKEGIFDAIDHVICMRVAYYLRARSDVAREGGPALQVLRLRKSVASVLSPVSARCDSEKSTIHV
jgi:hypothetical protein